MSQITLKQGEAKTAKVTVRDKNGASVDLSGAVCLFTVVSRSNYQNKLIEKQDEDFGKTEVASGILYIPFSTTDTGIQVGVYDAELRLEFATDNIDKSRTIRFEIAKAIT